MKRLSIAIALVIAGCGFKPGATGDGGAGSADAVIAADSLVPGRDGAVDAARDAQRPDAAIDARPIDARPVDARPVDAREVDAREVDAREVDARPIDARPIDAREVDARPIDAAPDAPIDAPIDAPPDASRPPIDAPTDAAASCGAAGEACCATAPACDAGLICLGICVLL